MRGLFMALLALPLAGCVVPVDPIQMAVRGPATQVAVVRAVGPMRAGDQVALEVFDTTLDRARLRHCVSQGMQARLPPGVEVIALDAERAATLAQVAPFYSGQETLDDRAAALGVGWAVEVRDGTGQSSHGGSGLGVGVGALGLGAVRMTNYHLRLEAELLDLQGRRRLGGVAANYSAEGGAAVVAGLVGGIPMILPIVYLPAGTTAMAICNAFGRSVADALVAASASVPPTADAPAAAEIPPR